jgi:hypothetical protein
VFLQGPFVRQELVQRTVQSFVIDFFIRNAQQLGQGRALVIVFGDMQFARGIAESTDDENQCDLGPGNVFFSSRDGAFEKLVELQFADQLEREPRSAELELVFDTNIRRVDLNPLGLETAFLIEELQLRSSRLLRAFRRSLDAGPFGLLELAEPSNRPLSRATLGSIRLD